MLLTTINLLASSGQKTVDCMTTMSVPSTLVKCLYLFFDLPHVPEAVGGAQNELPLAERRGLLQKVFVQILVKLCSFVSPAEELAQKDDRQLLFSAVPSWCPPYNLPWRKSAGEVLMTISRHGLSVNVVKYIHGEYFFMFIFGALSFFQFSLPHMTTDCFLSLNSLKILF